MSSAERGYAVEDEDALEAGAAFVERFVARLRCMSCGAQVDPATETGAWSVSVCVRGGRVVALALGHHNCIERMSGVSGDEMALKVKINAALASARPARGRGES